MATPIAVYEKDGQERAAYTQAEIVRLKFDGWRLKQHPKATDEPPPRGGSGSARDSWAEYATTHGVVVEDEMTREDIIAKLEALGVPTSPPPSE